MGETAGAGMGPNQNCRIRGCNFHGYTVYHVIPYEITRVMNVGFTRMKYLNQGNAPYCGGTSKKTPLKALSLFLWWFWRDFPWLIQQNCVFWLTTQIDWDLEDCCFRTENHQRVSQKWWHRMRFDCSSFLGDDVSVFREDTYHKTSKNWSFQSGEIQEKIQRISFRMIRDIQSIGQAVVLTGWPRTKKVSDQLLYILGKL